MEISGLKMLKESLMLSLANLAYLCLTLRDALRSLNSKLRSPPEVVLMHIPHARVQGRGCPEDCASQARRPLGMALVGVGGRAGEPFL
jgi:hypothetical protein